MKLLQLYSNLYHFFSFIGFVMLIMPLFIFHEKYLIHSAILDEIVGGYSVAINFSAAFHSYNSPAGFLFLILTAASVLLCAYFGSAYASLLDKLSRNNSDGNQDCNNRQSFPD